MADFIEMLSPKQLVDISDNFDYLKATEKFIGEKLFPLKKSNNIKLDLMRLEESSKIPVMAQVHGLDTEARIGDRPNPVRTNAEMFYVKEKLDQGERLTKYLRETGMDRTKDAFNKIIFDDAKNLIHRVLTRAEVAICELLSTGKLTINENNVSLEFDYVTDEKQYLEVSSWGTSTTKILAKLNEIQKLTGYKIKRMLTSGKVLGYLLTNDEIIALAKQTGDYPNKVWLENYFATKVGIEIYTYDEVYKKSALENTKYRFYPENKITFLTTTGALGNTFTTTSPLEDFNTAKTVFKGHVGLKQWKGEDPETIWTLAGGIFLPAPQTPEELWICTVKS
jgi:hypothetical protein